MQPSTATTPSPPPPATPPCRRCASVNPSKLAEPASVHQRHAGAGHRTRREGEREPQGHMMRPAETVAAVDWWWLVGRVLARESWCAAESSCYCVSLLFLIEAIFIPYAPRKRWEWRIGSSWLSALPKRVAGPSSHRISVLSSHLQLICLVASFSKLNPGCPAAFCNTNL